MTDPGWYDFEDLPERLRLQARVLRPRWPHEEFRRFQFRVKADGNVSARVGDHKLTAEAAAEIDKWLAEPAPHPSKRKLSANERGDLSHFRTATFGLGKERP